jgi:DNA segregation ATPase FtsK/SpoIIIE, S-DNA-T family
MAKRRKTKKPNNSFIIEIYGIVIVAVSLLIGLSIFKQPLGEFGIIFRSFFMGLLGIGSFIFPIFTFFIGITLIINRGDFKIRKRFVGICLLSLNILLLIHIGYSDNIHALSITKAFKDSFDNGLLSKGGGVISEIIDIPLIYIFGNIGSYIILGGLMLINGIIATEISIGEIINNLIDKIKARPKKEKKVKPLKDVVIQEDITSEKHNLENSQNLNNEENVERMDKKIKILDFMKNENNLVDKDVEINEKRENHIDTKKIGELEKEGKQVIIEELISVNKNEVKTMEYKFPSIDLLNESKNKPNSQDKKELLSNAKILEDTLKSFGVDAKVLQVSRGPSVTRYELQPSPGVKVSRITSLSDDLALNLAASAVRIEAPIPGKAAVGIEVPNKEVVPVTLREVIESNEFKEFNSKVAFSIGKDISGRCIVTDIAKMPHLLIAGATGSGKSVCINTLITSIIYKSSPEDVKMLMIDPKVVELSVYNGIPHLLIPVVTDPKKASSALYWAVNEMTNRYKLFADNNVRNIESYNKMIETKALGAKLPQIVIIIDELADLMMAAPNDVEDTICRLAQMARAAGMHLVIATQRPSVDVITGIIKANIPSRISFAVSSQIDSRTILDMAGAEKLLGKGDMLFLPIGENKPLRIQGAFISEKEVERIVEFLKKSAITDYNTEIIEEIESSLETAAPTTEDVDELLPEAIRVAVDYGQVSASMLQRRLRVGFNRAARLVEEMELRGIVGPQDGSKARQVLVSKDEYENNF